MSFGQKPTAWARQPGPAPNQQLNPNLFTNQLGLAAAQPFATMPAMSLNSSLNALVNQAAFSNMNNVLAQAQVAQRAQQLMPQSVAPQHARQPSPPPAKNQRTFLGTVTKLMETYGFVDEDVFFQTNVIRGAVPRVGDRVMVEASFNPSMPFKWNAYRIQLAQAQDTMPTQQQQQQPQQQQSQMYNSRVGQQAASNSGVVLPPTDGLLKQMIAETTTEGACKSSPPSNTARRSPVSRHRSPARRSPSRKSSPVRSERKREREKSKSREPTRTRSPTATKEVSKRDEASPPRRRQRIIPRYHCHIPKQIVQSNELKYLDLRKRYSTMYVPSDFIRCNMSWLKSIQLDEPIKFSPHPINYTVLHKDVDLEELDVTLENPPDADSRFIVKVLLLAQPGQSALRQKVYGLLPDGSIDEAVETQSVLKNLQFLVGCRGKNELMCIGGPWSPSLDGDNPMDPQTLVNTAIRTTRALIGVDLSACSKWYKMVHLHYFRAERNRVDSVVLMLPDTSTLMPSVTAFAEMEQSLKNQLATKLAAIDAETFPLDLPTSSSSSEGQDLAKGADSVAVANPNVSEENAGESSQPTDQANTSEVNAAEKPVDENAAGKKTTHWSQLNIKTMKVVELREELDARGIDSKGVKNTLFQRLQEALDKEKAEEEANASTKPADTSSTTPAAEDTVVVKQEAGEDQMDTSEKPAEDLMATEELVEKVDDAAAAEKAEKELKELEKAKEKFEKEKKDRKASLERHFATIPKVPSVLIYPSKTAKGGKFDCKCSSLSTLLDYRQDDNKEASFEVFLFAEALREAIDRSNAFLVYHALDSALPRDGERKRRDEVLNSETPKEPATEVEGAEATSNGDAQMETDAAVEKPAAAEKEVPPADPRTKYKAFVHDVEMFSAFAHFDENVCGHIDDRDMEEILYTIGIDFSRGDVQRITKKLSSRDRINYRNLTDRWVDKDGNVKYVPSPALKLEVWPSWQLAIVSHQKKRVARNGHKSQPWAPHLIAQHNPEHGTAEGVENERNVALLKNDQLELQLKTTKEKCDYFEKKKRRLEDDVDRYKKKLHDSEKSFKNLQEDTAQMKSTLQDCKSLTPKEESSSQKSEIKTEKTGGEASEDTQQKAETAAAPEEEVYEVRDEELEPEDTTEQAAEATPESTGQTEADKSNLVYYQQLICCWIVVVVYVDTLFSLSHILN
uniref:SAP domain-containing protein n=1 Tax=Ditylenchus dipsaci TaxID=166011 RepID=A0A915DXN7_9BILA